MTSPAARAPRGHGQAKAFRRREAFRQDPDVRKHNFPTQTPPLPVSDPQVRWHWTRVVTARESRRKCKLIV